MFHVEQVGFLGWVLKNHTRNNPMIHPVPSTSMLCSSASLFLLPFFPMMARH